MAPKAPILELQGPDTVLEQKCRCMSVSYLLLVIAAVLAVIAVSLLLVLLSGSGGNVNMVYAPVLGDLEVVLFEGGCHHATMPGAVK